MNLNFFTNPNATDTCSMFSLPETRIDELIKIVDGWKVNFENFGQMLIEAEKYHTEGQLTDQEFMFCFYAIGIHHGRDAERKASFLKDELEEKMSKLAQLLTRRKPDVDDAQNRIEDNYKW